ncbi:MAG TPA: glycogen synthase GlgA [Burkholderiales bacterium]|nr:glycogen synthase GlgA [Burkholderiales bacterium]
MRVLYVAAEAYPLEKTGGLGDVTGALPPALIRQGLDVRLLLPGLPAIIKGMLDLKPVAKLEPAFSARAITLLAGRMPDSGVPAYVIDAPDLYERPGNPYLGPDGRDWGDNHQRFALLGSVAARLATGSLDSRWTADVIHSHDWHAGLAPAYASAQSGPRPGTVFTIHNLAYQGLFPYERYADLGLPPEFFAVDGLEFYGQVSFMKAGLFFADRVTTVSPTYALEIHGPEEGCGLEGVISARGGAVKGILNGVDYQVWNPATDPVLPQDYTAANLKGKAACKAALQADLGLEIRPDTLLFCAVSRLTPQKGLDLALNALPEIIRQGGQLVLLGSGDADMEERFRQAAAKYPQSVSATIGYDEAFSHKIIAGSDVVLVPSRFEPCGLTQLYGLRYGTLPLVRRVGGLADTVLDANQSNLKNDTATGFVFESADVADFSDAVGRAFAAYGDRSIWSKLIRRAMAQNFSWDEAALEYASLYRDVSEGVK